LALSTPLARFASALADLAVTEVGKKGLRGLTPGELKALVRGDVWFYRRLGARGIDEVVGRDLQAL
jgi:hypothetical protein